MVTIMLNNIFTLDQIVDLYAEELENWNFFSDSQRAYVDENKHIVVCLRDYSWYITKEPIVDFKTCLKAIFEIDWIAEYDNEDDVYGFINTSKYWDKY